MQVANKAYLKRFFMSHLNSSYVPRAYFLRSWLITDSQRFEDLLLRLLIVN